MKPIQIFLMLVVTHLLVGCIIVFFPEDGVELGDTEVRFLAVNDLVPAEKVKTIRDVLPAYDLAGALSDTSILIADQLEASEEDDPVFIEINDEGKLAFRDFFEKLSSAKQDATVVRVMHYGDSQIEGDRISSVLRERLQAKYGGAGVGLLPVNEPSHSRMCVTMERSGPWIRKQVFGTPDRKLENGEYGLLGFAHTLKKDSLTDSLVGSVLVKANSHFFKRTAQGRQLRIIYNAPVPFEVKVNEEAHFLDSSLLPVVKTWKFDEDQKEMQLLVNAADSMAIFALCLDGDYGVAVDNIPIRGSSGLEFTHIKKSHLQAQYSQLDVGLIIYQFGVNVVPHVVDDYDFYKSRVKRQLKRLQELNPGIPILVIGTSDMSRKEGSNYVSFPNIEQIRDAQKSAALEAGCGFWDLYQVMGGANSMPAWVFADPPLAQKDFLHFNKQGANIVGQKLYQAIMQLNQELLGSL